uniref:L-amino-acid oxidase n=1 Tax=Naja naja TaxID=35670 RepID=A0A8C6V6A3_NAJNA
MQGRERRGTRLAPVPSFARCQHRNVEEAALWGRQHAAGLPPPHPAGEKGGCDLPQGRGRFPALALSLHRRSPFKQPEANRRQRRSPFLLPAGEALTDGDPQKAVRGGRELVDEILAHRGVEVEPAAGERGLVSAQEKDGADSLVTQRVCREDELHAGEMREVEVAGYPVLLVREGLNIRALGGRCPHAGAALCKGYLAKGRLRCPWHGACFSTETGDIEEYPTLDCLPVFQVTVQEGQVHISARMKDLESSRRVKPMAQECQLDPQTVLLLGAGPAALTCAETLRQEGFSGRIIMATWENHLPYDRTKLTQDLGVPAESLYLRSQRFLDAHDIEVWKQSEVGGGWHELTSPWWFVSPPGQAAVLACRVLKLSRGKGSTVKGSLLHWGGNKPLGRSCPPHLMDLGSTQQHLGKDQHRHHGRNWSQCWTSPASFEFAAGLGPAWTGGGGGGGFTWAPAQPLGIQHGFHLAAGGVSGSCRQNGPLPGRGIPGDSNLLIATGSR